ncbi:fatty acyl-CoA reductase 1-like [Microplitis mediator]|uniref:fatty acyl-CoA reductase 1-like n=1 Tax=Microplitis mediator TaxID=375433 RepID=UPI0025558DC4|nr:fatty acyl-CoA reductase 1-like [Microplitis mediator]
MDDIYRRISEEDDFGEDETERSEIQEFFHGQTILLTGCTGFLGKSFVEKILRDCAGIKKLILIVRSHKVSAKERMKKYFQNEIFEKLRSYRPNFESKVCIVEGNLNEENLDLSIEDRKMLMDEVTMIYHNASNVKFATKVSDSLKCNVFGTKYMIELARACKKLVCFMYISTAYSHSYNKVIEEKCYPPPAGLKMVQDMIDADEIAKNGIPQATVDETCKPWANIYTFGKSIAESLVEEFGKETSYPCIIYRPSQILSTYQEPFPGWCGNYNGPALAFIGYGLGIIHTNTPVDYVQDYVPADMCTNSILALTWDTVTNRKQESGKVFVFNYASSTVNPMSLHEFEDACVPKGKESPSSRMIAPNFMIRPPCFFLLYVIHFLFHGIPAVIADIVLMAMLRKPRAIAMFYKITMNLKSILYWGTSDWRITVKETQKMWDRMNNRDRFLFYNDLRTINWSAFGYTYWFGIKKYLLKEPLVDPPARRKYVMIQFVFHSFKNLIILYILYCLFSYWLSLISPITEFVKLKYICHM